jgi:hypothetical protein
MSAEPFPAPRLDVPKPADDPEDTWFLDEEWESAAYFGSLMTAAGEGEELTAQDISGSGFGQDGTADQLRPGPMLATLVHAATSNQQVLASLPDDDLIGIIRAARKTESLIAWAQLTAIREFATRSGSQTAARRTSAAPCPDPAVREFAADELTGPLTMTWQGAAGEIGYARTVPGGCRIVSLRWQPEGCTQDSYGSSRRRPRSCPTPTPTPTSRSPMRCWPGWLRARRQGNCAPWPAGWSCGSIPIPRDAAGKPPAAMPRSASSPSGLATPGWSPTNCPPMRRPPG